MQGRQLVASEQICRDLRSRESDLQEMLTAKETQFDVLRMRLDEADRLLELEKQRIVDLQAERDRLVTSTVCWCVVSWCKKAGFVSWPDVIKGD